MRAMIRPIFFCTMLLLSAQAAVADARGSFTKTLTVGANPEVEVSTGSGNITVHSGSGNSVTVTAQIHANDQWFGGGSLSADEKVKRIESNPPVQQSGNLVTIGRINDSDLRRNVSIDYDISLPAGSRLRTESGSGDVKVDGVNGTVRMSTGSGNVTGKRLGDEVRISTGSGDIRLEVAKGPVRANAGSGNIEASGIAGAFYGETGSGDITLRQEASGTVSARTGSGSVRLHNVNGGLEAHSGSGDIEVDGEAKNDWNLQSGSGSIELKLPTKAAFSLDARSSSGSVTVNHPITVQGEVKRNRVQGRVGSGGPLVSLQTSSGEIRVN